MKDCYKILGVRPSASAAEIKRAFRLKAKELHPDLSESNSSETAEFHALLEAYETLSDIHQRALFDTLYATQYQSRSDVYGFDYRHWLCAQTDEESRCKLVFLDLLRNREEDAIAEYKRLASSRAGFSLSRWFVREDFMDFGFILAEELVFAGDYYDAYVLLSQIIRMEYRFAYFKHFFPEVIKLARDVLRGKLAGIVSDELALDAWEDALDLGLGKKDDAYFLRLMAEAYERLGDTQTAVVCLREAMRIDPATVIPLRMKKRLGVA